MSLALVSCGETASTSETQNGGHPVKDYLTKELNNRIGYGHTVIIASTDSEAFQTLIVRQSIRSIGQRQGDKMSLGIHDHDWERFLQLLEDDADTFDAFAIEFPEEDAE